MAHTLIPLVDDVTHLPPDSELAALDARYPVLVAGKVASSAIPSVALVSVQVAASQSAQLALTTQEGDVVTRSDTLNTYMRNSGTSGTMSDFTLLNTPADLVTSVAGRTGAVVIAESDVTGLTADLALKATLANPTFTGTVTLPTGTVGVTQTAGDSSTKLATTAFVTTADNLKAPLASPTFTGTPTLPTGTIAVTQSQGDNSTKPATTAYVDTGLALKAALASPTFTGTPTLPTGTIVVTQSQGDNSTKPASTAYVDAGLAAQAAAPVMPDAVTSGETTMARDFVNSTGVVSSTGTMRLSFFTATKTETVTQVKVITGATAAAATPTLVRVGIYSVNSGTGDITLINSTVSDTTLLAATQTAYTKALSSNFSKVKGTRYAVGVLQVSGSATATLMGNSNSLISTELAVGPRTSALQSGLSDLPSSVLAGALGNSQSRPYIALLP